jgi:hypothetical protein
MTVEDSIALLTALDTVISAPPTNASMKGVFRKHPFRGLAPGYRIENVAKALPTYADLDEPFINERVESCRT